MENERLVWEERGSIWTETGEVSGFVVIYNKTLRVLGEAGNLRNSENPQILQGEEGTHRSYQHNRTKTQKAVLVGEYKIQCLPISYTEIKQRQVFEMNK